MTVLTLQGLSLMFYIIFKKKKKLYDELKKGLNMETMVFFNSTDNLIDNTVVRKCNRQSFTNTQSWPYSFRYSILFLKSFSSPTMGTVWYPLYNYVRPNYAMTWFKFHLTNVKVPQLFQETQKLYLHKCSTESGNKRYNQFNFNFN